MRDIELYRQVLGLQAPWTVTEVKLDVPGQRVDVFVDHASAERWACPECGKALGLYDHSEERIWRHLDTCQFLTYLHARPPRVKCPAHGVRQVRLPWAEPHSRFTALFERLAIDVLLASDITGATRILRISWDEAWHLQERAVARGQQAKRPHVPRHLGVDEKAVAKGRKYLTLVCDADAGTVEHIADDHTHASLDEYFERLTPEQRARIDAVAMDMWDPYIKSVKTYLPDGAEKIVFDRFHIMVQMGTAVDRVRKQEHRALRAAGDDTLTGTKYLWLYNRQNLPERHHARFADLIAGDLRTGRAWAIKERLRQLWGYTHRTWARKFFRRWYYWATHSRLSPVIAAAKTLERHLPNVLTYFEQPITNAVSEGLNSKIQTIKKMAYGFRNKDHFKTAIYFHCGGLPLYPATHGNV
jgi:transposase